MIGLLALAALGQEPIVDPPWYAGRPVADVRLLSPEGGVPDESLEPLLRATQGEPLDPQALRLDLATLFRVGEFSAVEADAQPWPVYDDSGEIREGVLVTYLVWPAPKIARLRVTGTRALREQEILEAARIGAGQVFYTALDVPVVRRRVLDLLRRRGFPEARVEVLNTLPEQGALDVEIQVDEGDPLTVDRLVFAGELPVEERALRRWARRAGVAEGEPLSTEAVTAAQLAIGERLGSLGGLLSPERGWVEARVTPAISGDGEGGTQVTYTIEPGRRLVLEVDGLPWRARSKVREALDLDGRFRLTRGFLEAAPERMEDWLHRRGYLAAEVVVSLAEPPDLDVQVLRVDVDRGPPHALHRVDFRGNAALDDETLRLVMDQASEEVIRLGRVTRPELARALGVVRDTYRSQGYLDATVELTDIRVTSRLDELTESGRPPLGRSLARPFTARLRYVVPEVTVSEGPLTTLVGLEVEGAAEGVPLGFVDEVKESLLGGPYSPQRLEQLLRRIVEAHRRAGYLEADARVSREQVDGDEMRAALHVEPGILVRLRSVVTRGARHTRSSIVRREVDLDLGQPITSTALDALRRDLYELEVFRTVSTELLGDEEARDLVIAVEERPLWAFELGGGASTDQGLRAFGRATRRNLWGRAHRFDLFGLLGLDWRSNSLRDWTPDVTDPEWRAALSYTAPHFPFRRQSVVVDLLLRERIQERTWQMSRSGLGVALETALGDKSNLQAGVRVETRRLEEYDPGTLLPGSPWSDILDDPSKGSWRLQDSLYAVLLHDERDNPFQPTRGAIVSVLGEWVPGVELLGPGRPQVAYLKSELRVSGWIPIGGPVVRVSGELGRAWMLGEGVLPLEDRYRLGGTGSLRGYRRDSLGPRNLVDQVDLDWPDSLEPSIDYATRTHPTRWVSTGGDARATGVLELVVPLPVLGLRAWEGYSVALFADAGNVWLLDADARGLATSDQDPWLDLFHPALRYSIGAGVRVATPVGPLQVDLAANPEAIRATGERKALLRDEWDEPVLRLHLSLGSL